MRPTCELTPGLSAILPELRDSGIQFRRDANHLFFSTRRHLAFQIAATSADVSDWCVRGRLRPLPSSSKAQWTSPDKSASFTNAFASPGRNRLSLALRSLVDQ